MKFPSVALALTVLVCETAAFAPSSVGSAALSGPVAFAPHQVSQTRSEKMGLTEMGLFGRRRAAKKINKEAKVSGDINEAGHEKLGREPEERWKLEQHIFLM